MDFSSLPAFTRRYAPRGAFSKTKRRRRWILPAARCASCYGVRGLVDKRRLRQWGADRAARPRKGRRRPDGNGHRDRSRGMDEYRDHAGSPFPCKAAFAAAAVPWRLSASPGQCTTSGKPFQGRCPPEKESPLRLTQEHAYFCERLQENPSGNVATGKVLRPGGVWGTTAIAAACLLRRDRCCS